MTDEKRPYRKTRRAELEAQTARRITESAVALHGTLGPSRTSVSTVAKHAGVRRSTVYRYFPDEVALFTACTGHWMAANPAPDLEPWAAIDDPDRRLAIALGELYAHYRRTSGMMENILRDEETVPVVKQLLGGYRAYLSAARDVLARGRAARGRHRLVVVAAIGHALAFSTWSSLTREQGLDDAQAVHLMQRLVAVAGTSPAVGGGSRLDSSLRSE